MQVLSLIYFKIQGEPSSISRAQPSLKQNKTPNCNKLMDIPLNLNLTDNQTVLVKNNICPSILF